MSVRLSKSVKSGIKAYRKALEQYPISQQRREEKVRDMREFLMNLDGNKRFKRCQWEDLGQTKDENGNILNNDLLLAVYEDPKSKKQWGFSYIKDDVRNIVIVLRMMYMPFVKCSFTQRIDKPYKRIFDDMPIKRNVHSFLTGLLDYRDKHPELFY